MSRLGLNGRCAVMGREKEQKNHSAMMSVKPLQRLKVVQRESAQVKSRDEI